MASVAATAADVALLAEKEENNLRPRHSKGAMGAGNLDFAIISTSHATKQPGT